MLNKELGTSAYVVLGLTLQEQELTPYELKQRIANSIGFFWTFSHPQIYTVTERLYENGFLTKRTETGGRRRKVYKVTRKGKKAFASWLAKPQQSHTELRDLAMLKLYFGEYADKDTIRQMATSQVQLHRARLEEYRQIPSRRELNKYALKTLELGIEFEKIAEKHWKKVASESEQ
jgi:PadR family transcriptional regulator AphA